MPQRENPPFPQETDQRTGETRATTASTANAALVGSALAFSDQMVRALSAEFSDLAFRRFAGLEQLRLEGHPPRLIVLECAAMQRLVDVVQALRNEFSGAAIAVAYHSTDSAAELADRLAMGAIAPPVGLIRNNLSLDVWLSIVRLLLCGENFIPYELLTPWRSPTADAPKDRARRKNGEQLAEHDVPLTRREMQVLPLIAEGKQNKEIAGALGLSEHTVKLHTHNIFVKLKVSNRTCAADWYRSVVRVTGARRGRWNGSASA